MSEEKLTEENNPRLTIKPLEDVMHDSMISYSEYVILDRALPRVEDGLKPVQRRILYSMNELGITPDKPYRKCARIVGDCLGKFHPHGDSSVYQALVRMAQPFSMGATLVDGHGNFGSVDGDGAAAMRYTEARMAPLALELLRDLEKNTVRWSWNFDDTLLEPDILPGRFPNLLVNGASGIAVGLSTNIPPHNLMECIDGVVAYIDNPRIKLKDMMKIIKAPDFPTGGVIIASEELERAYETGKGKIMLRAKMHIENGDYNRKSIIIDELPFQVNKAELLENINRCREEKKGVLSGIADIADESDRVGMRAVIKLKQDADPKPIIEMLFKCTNLQTSFAINMVAIANGKPQLMGLLDIIAYYVDYQRNVILRRTKFELDAAQKREHILEGLVIAVRNIDEVIKIIKASQSTSDARENLRKRFDLSEVQAQAILDLRLARLTHLEVYKLEKELADVRSLIARLQSIIASRSAQMDLIKVELMQIRKAYRENRKSLLLNDVKKYVIPSDDDEKPVEDYIVVYNASNQIKRMLVKNFTMATKDYTDTSTLNEFCSSIVRAKSIDRVYAFTNLGNCYKLDVDSIPDGKWREKGSPLKKVFPDSLEGERIVFMQAVSDGEGLPKGNILFYTKGGMVKRSEWKEYSVVKTSFQAVKLKEEDEVITMEHEQEGASLLFVTREGMCLNCDMSDIPLQGRIAGGVKGIALNDGDYCIMARQITDGGEIVVVSDRGYGKRVIAGSLDVMARYRKGVRIYDNTKAAVGATLAFASYVKEPYKLVFNVIAPEGDSYLTAFSTEALSIENRTHSGKPLIRNKVTIDNVYIYNDKLVNG